MPLWVKVMNRVGLSKKKNIYRYTVILTNISEAKRNKKCEGKKGTLGTLAQLRRKREREKKKRLHATPPILEWLDDWLFWLVFLNHKLGPLSLDSSSQNSSNVFCLMPRLMSGEQQTKQLHILYNREKPTTLLVFYVSTLWIVLAHKVNCFVVCNLNGTQWRYFLSHFVLISQSKVRCTRSRLGIAKDLIELEITFWTIVGKTGGCSEHLLFNWNFNSFPTLFHSLIM